GRQGPVRPGPAPGPHLEILVPLTTLAMLAHAFLTAVAVSEHARQPAEPDLIPLTLAEIQHLMARLTSRPPAPFEHYRHWSRWRRHHQAHVRTCHYQRQSARQH